MTGREVSGDYVHEKGNVWIHNAEDPLDEIARRIGAACEVLRVKSHELKGRLFYTSGRAMPLKLVTEANRQLLVNDSTIMLIRKFITEHAIKLWVIDPFVDMHECDENDNRAINKVVKILSAIAEETGCSIHIVHHTRKKSKDGGLTDMDMARGASALLSAARIGRNLNGMSDKDAGNYILPLAPSWYVRLDNSKANLSGPTESTQWFEKVSVELPNGDSVGVLKPVELVRVGDGDRNELFRRRACELVDEAGGAMTLNMICTHILKDKDVTLTRNAIRDRLIKKVFSHSYVTAEGAEYNLVHAAPGQRDGMSIVRTDKNLKRTDT